MKRIGISLILLSFLVNCVDPVRDRRRVEVPGAIQKAQTATLPELVKRFNDRWAGIHSLTVSRFNIELTSGSLEVGYFEEYRTARGYLVAADTGGIFVNILNPLTNSSVLTMASQEQQFQIWIPRDNQYITGSTDVQLKEENPLYNVRPVHILEAVLIEPLALDSPDDVVLWEEQQDERFSYYVVTVARRPERDNSVSELIRKIWIERSELRLVRQQYYEGPQIRSVILYADPFPVGEKWIFSEVVLERPQDHYSLRFEVETGGVRLDRPIKAGDFDLPVPPGAEVIRVEGRTGAN